MNNPVYEAQLNRHEEKISEISGRLHSYDLGLRWCEEQIKKLAGDDYSCCVRITEDVRYNELSKEYDKLKSDYNNLKEEVEKWKDAYLRSQVDVNNFQAAYSEEHSKRLDVIIKNQINSDDLSFAKEEIKRLKEENERLRELYCCAIKGRKENKE